MNKICGAVCTSQYASGGICQNYARPDADRCYLHGGPASQDPVSGRQRRLALARKDKQRRMRQAHEWANQQLDGLGRVKKIARWMLHGGGDEAFAQFDATCHVGTTCDDA